MSKYVIRVQRYGIRQRFYFPNRGSARDFARRLRIPHSQIKRT